MLLSLLLLSLVCVCVCDGKYVQLKTYLWESFSPFTTLLLASNSNHQGGMASTFTYLSGIKYSQGGPHISKMYRTENE